ncbi:hypothetical protein [Acaryochloris marina]|uniref:hypothetical protein n=1 Tax=Acaryochloris marina TaxID=155978 RepID=UPI001BAF79B2|nr:hypothetical protein [Acaryochloris marina]QUY44158.1 hypothetical protein I1H34_08740 [Acaryochloris marina S15]
MVEKTVFFSEISPSDQKVNFWGPPQAHQQRQVLVLSIPYADQIFGALHNKYRHWPNVTMAAVIQDWADMAGWWEAEGSCAIAPDDTAVLSDWLASLRVEEIDCDQPSPAELMACIQALQSFLYRHWVQGELVYIEHH